MYAQTPTSIKLLFLRRCAPWKHFFVLLRSSSKNRNYRATAGRKNALRSVKIGSVEHA